MIVFAERWEESKETTWSGTPYGIYTGLKELLPEQELISLELGQNRYLKSVKRMKKHFYKLGNVNDCGIPSIQEESTELAAFDKKNRADSYLMFSEHQFPGVNNSYVFIDCSVDFTYRKQQEHVAYKQYLPLYQEKSKSLIAKREKEALEFYQNCKGIFTMGQWLAEDLVQNTGIAPEKVHCVGGGCNIDIEKIDPSQKQGNKILFVGKDFFRKGGIQVLDAFKLIDKKEPEKYTLYIAGPKSWPLDTPIPKNVVFLGLLKTDELIKYYNMADLFVMPSIFEAYGIVFAEALIFGLPCIGRNAFSMKDFIQPGVNGDLVETEEPEELANKILSVLNNQNIRKNVNKYRKEYIKRYSWNSVAQRILNVMKKDNLHLQ